MFLTKRFFIISIYFLIVNLLGIFISYIGYSNYFFCSDCSNVDSSNTIFDYIVVGCGSAGAIVAKRLAEDKTNQILILEAGSHGSSLLDIPSLGLLLQKTSYDWMYETVPQSNSCGSLNNNASHWPMGKIVGGTGMLNNMIYVRGHFKDFNDWFQDKEGYNYTKDVLPYFKKLEDQYIEGDEKGSIYISDLLFTSILPKVVLDAVEELGFFNIVDRTLSVKGFGMPKVNLYNGRRWTPAHHLVRTGRKNILLCSNRIVREILFKENFEAYGVKYSYSNKFYEARASKGIILAAGVVGSPRILMHSGIGPKRHLSEVNIQPKIDLPVGENLQDHITTGLDLILLNQSLGIGIEQMLSPYSIFQYFWQGAGPWTTVGCELLGYFNINESITRQRNCDQPHLQFMVMPLGISEDNGVYLRHLLSISDYTWNNYFALLNQTVAMTILPILLHPKSRGFIRLFDNNFETKPLINPKYLSHPDDVNVLRRGIDVVKKIINTKQMQKLGARLNENVFPGCENFKFDTKQYWDCYIRQLTITSYHPVGTCKMGHNADSTAVVNYNFEVKGTNNLFIVDGSVIPTLTSGNVNGAIFMLAEMASDLFKYKFFLSKSKCSVKEIFIYRNFC